MTPSHRNRSQSISSSNSYDPQNRHVEQRHPPLPLPPPSPLPLPLISPNLGMSPASKYSHNLKVLRRRDPSITLIFDQFSHVCVYHHNGDKWEKHGFEGSMFLYERESYPPYGFYILNRVGMDDYIQRLYPEDSVGAHGSYLMLRSYPEFTSRRLEEARATLSPSLREGPLAKFADAFRIDSPDSLQDSHKGPAQVVGLWCFASEARESMIDVMFRLHSYIKRNIPYPADYRYGPDRSPLGGQALADYPNGTAGIAINGHPSEHPWEQRREMLRTPDQSGSFLSSMFPAANYSSNGEGGVSELDKLFAKLGPTTVPPSSSSSVSLDHPSEPTSSKVTMDSLFASVSSTQLPVNGQLPALPTPSASNKTISAGTSLLDTLFASASPLPTTSSASTLSYQYMSAPPSFPDPPSAPPSTRSPPIHVRKTSVPQTPPAFSQDPYILSPKPTSSSLPQILNQDVISSLLGLGPTPNSRASSATASSSGSRRSGHSAQYLYEGDNESNDDDNLSDGGYSESSTVLDADAEVNIELQAAGSSAGIPLLAVPPGNESGGPQDNILGDVTPRPAIRGMESDITTVNERLVASTSPSLKGAQRPACLIATSSAPHLQAPHPSHSNGLYEVDGHLHGFSPSSSPAPRLTSKTAPPHLRSTNGGGTPTVNPPAHKTLVPFEADSELWPYPRASLDVRSLEQDDIVELDFADTSALNDPEAFMSRLREQEQRTSGNANGAGPAVDNKTGIGKKDKSKRGKRDRAAEKEREKERIEQSWDVPDALRKDSGAQSSLLPPAVPAPVASSFSSSLSSRQHINGKAKQAPNVSKSHQSGSATAIDSLPSVDRVAVEQSILSTLSSHPKLVAKTMPRNDFVREVLTLIHTDKRFVDSLWQNYTSHVAT